MKRIALGTTLSLSIILGVTGLSAADRGEKVGKKHAAYARSLAADGYEFGSDRLSWLSDYEDSCSGFVTVTPPAEPDRQRQLSTFLDLFCKPWNQLWDSVLNACDGEHAPSWCQDEGAVYDHLTLDGYYAALQSALTNATSPLERYNVINVMVNVLDAHVASELPEARLEKAYVGAVATYFNTAGPDDVIALGRHLQRTWLGLPPPVAQQFAAYVEHHDGLSPEQKKLILGLSNQRFDE